jgi:hypothetical protein
MSGLFIKLFGAQKLPMWQPIERIPPWASIRGLLSDRISGVFFFLQQNSYLAEFF